MDIKAQKLTGENFNTFGQAIFVSRSKVPDNSGEGWECWFPLQQLDLNRDFSFGLVKSLPVQLQVRCLERHLDRPEYIIALDNPVIQVVSLDYSGNPDLPDPRQTQAFLIEPGQIVKINPGIWHAAGLAANRVVTQYMFLLGKPTEGLKNVDSGQVQYPQGEVVFITI